MFCFVLFCSLRVGSLHPQPAVAAAVAVAVVVAVMVIVVATAAAFGIDVVVVVVVVCVQKYSTHHYACAFLLQCLSLHSNDTHF